MRERDDGPAREPVPDGVNRRRFLRAAAATGGLAVAGVGTAAAEHDDGGRGNPLAGFGGTSCDVPRTSDRYLPFDTGGRFGGWGGHEYHVTEPGVRAGQNPVVFVHGNTHDACDFSEHAEAYLDRGYRGDELWAITFREGTSTHPEMRDQLDAFVRKVRAHTGAPRLDFVSHSLGVTGVRFWMDDRDRYDWVDTFVGLAGGNHGTYTCGPTCSSKPGASEPCGFISPACAEPGGPLHDLNTPDETPHGDRIDYYTVRGTADYFYADDPDSPELAGADANVVVNGAHNATRAGSTAIELVYQWVTDGTPGPDAAGGDPVPDVSGSRRDSGTVFAAGRPNEVRLSASAGTDVLLRDRVPYTWDVLRDAGDVEAVAPRPHAGVTEVYFRANAATAHDVRYLVEAPSGSNAPGSYTFGPAQVRRPGDAGWTDVPGTTERSVVLGPL